MNIQPRGVQTDVLALPIGCYVILGTAGSGKSVMALLRAMQLCNLDPRSNVLLITFNTALVNYFNTLVENECPNNLYIENYHKFARGYLHSKNKLGINSIVETKNDKIQLISEALAQVREDYPGESTLNRTVDFFYDEISFMESFGLLDKDSYLSSVRIGRAVENLKQENRIFVYKVYEAYMRIRRAQNYSYDWDDIAYYVYKELNKDASKRMYRHIIIDEGQDFSPMMVKSLVKAKDINGSIMFFGDAAQQIYGSRISWRELGLPVDKIIRFEINYRNPANISEFAEDIKKSPYWLSQEDMIPPQNAIFMGPRPVLIKFSNLPEEIWWVVNKALEASSMSSVVIIVRRRSLFKKFIQYLHPYQYTIINHNSAIKAGKNGLYFSTFHSVKGLEFDQVYIPLLSDKYFPDSEELSERSYDIQQALWNELKLFYVAVTRSKGELFMTYNGTLSPLFPNSNHYKKSCI